MAERLIESLATTESFAEIFSDRSLLAAMLDFEVALARAEARLNIIPSAAAETIAACSCPSDVDLKALVLETPVSGTPAVPLVKALTEQIRRKDPRAAGFVHWGATSQDVCDTALILLLKKVQAILESDLRRLQAALRRLAQEHRHTVMLSRTLLQPAPPTTLGFKASGWLAAIHRTRRRLRAAFKESLILQFGGASGTLAALGSQGVPVGKLLAEELGLVFPEAPWHAHRDRVATLVSACGVLGGTLAKMARDISLLAQSEVGEVAESSGPGRGGSSAMPHKRNPVGCAVTLAAASHLPGLVSNFLAGMAQEHERGLGGWQAEWATVSRVMQATGLATASMVEVAEGLTIDSARMRDNIEATRGAVFAEQAMMMLAKNLGRDSAYKIVEVAVRRSVEQKRRLAEVLREMPEAMDHIDPKALHELENPAQYLGAAEEFQDRLLASADEDAGGGPETKEH